MCPHNPYWDHEDRKKWSDGTYDGFIDAMYKHGYDDERYAKDNYYETTKEMLKSRQKNDKRTKHPSRF